jgi:hypothetical protein
MATTKKKPQSSTRSRSQRRFTRQARDEAFLRFNPERSSLRGALQDAAETLEQEVGTARGTALGVKQAARESVPQFKSVYGQAQTDVGQGEKDLLAATGGSPIAPAAARDAVGAQRRLSESLAGALSEATNRQTEAQSGASFAINQAQSRYGRNVERVQTRLGDLSAEEGRYVSGRLGELLGAQTERRFKATQADKKLRADARQKRADRAVTRRGQTLTHEDRQAAAAAKKAADAAKKKGTTLPGGVKPRTAGDQTTFRDSVAKALRTVRPYVKTLTRDKARGLFLNGAQAQTIVDDKKLANLVAQNNSKPRDQRQSITDLRRRATTTLPAVPAIPETQLRVVFDMLYDGHLSRETVAKLHAAGITVKPMGMTTDRNAPRPGGVKRPPTAAQRAAQSARDRKLGSLIPASPFGGG